MINRGVETDVHAGKGFDTVSAAVSGVWAVDDADAGRGVGAFVTKDGLSQQRGDLALDFWSDGALR